MEHFIWKIVEEYTYMFEKDKKNEVKRTNWMHIQVKGLNLWVCKCWNIIGEGTTLDIVEREQEQ